MFYEETVIEGILHYRNHPEGPWKACSKEYLTQKLLCLREEYKQVMRVINKYVPETPEKTDS